MKVTTGLLFTFCLLCSNMLFGQSKSDRIEIERRPGTIFKQNGKKLNARQMLEIMRSNSCATSQMRRAKFNMNVSVIYGFIGGALVGWQLGTAIAGGEPEWALAGVGAVFIVYSFQRSSAYVKHAKRAVEFYNDELSQTRFKSLDYHLAFTPNGVGLKMNF